MGYEGSLVPLSDVRVVFLVVEVPEVQIPFIEVEVDAVTGRSRSRKTTQPACAFFHNIQLGGISTDLLNNMCRAMGVDSMAARLFLVTLKKIELELDR